MYACKAALHLQQRQSAPVNPRGALMASQPAASLAAEDGSQLLAADGALFNYKFLQRMYGIGIVVFFILFYTHREEG
jgi:hypothetical protein